MTKVVEVDFRHRAKFAAQADEASKERRERIVYEQLEVAFRNAYKLWEPHVVLERIHYVQSKVELDYGVVRIL